MSLAARSNPKAMPSLLCLILILTTACAAGTHPGSGPEDPHEKSPKAETRMPRAQTDMADGPVLLPVVMGVDVLDVVSLGGGEVEHVAVGIMGRIGGEGARGGPFQDRDADLLELCHGSFEIIDLDAVMVETRGPSGAPWVDVHPNITVADADRPVGARVG